MSRYEEIEAFVRTVESGSFTRAAAQLGVAKSAISRRITELEARLGAQLLSRTTRKLTLTETGTAFLARTSTLLEAWEEAEALARETQTALSGKLRIAAPLSFGIAHLSPALMDFVCAHPEIDLDVDFSDRKSDLIAEGLDMAVRIGDLADSSLIARKLGPIRFVCAASPAYIATHGPITTPEDLMALNELAYTDRPKSSWSFKAPDGTRGSIEFAGRLGANNGDFLRDAALRGLGFVIEPSFLLYKNLRAGDLVTLLPDYEFPGLTAYAVYPPTRYVPARVRALIDHLIACFGKTPYWDEC